MLGSAIPEENWRKTANAVQEKEAVEIVAGKLLKAMISTSNDLVDHGQPIDIEVVDKNDINVLATISTHFGQGRLVLEWDLSRDQLAGLLVVEKKSRDRMDRAVWIPVWGLSIPQHGDPTTIDGTFSIRLTDYLGGDRRRTVFEGLMCIVYAIASGPSS